AAQRKPQTSTGGRFRLADQSRAAMKMGGSVEAGLGSQPGGGAAKGRRVRLHAGPGSNPYRDQPVMDELRSSRRTCGHGWRREVASSYANNSCGRGRCGTLRKVVWRRIRLEWTQANCVGRTRRPSAPPPLRPLGTYRGRKPY
ncbi:unnamed protein product, partial [Musa banksii]